MAEPRVRIGIEPSSDQAAVVRQFLESKRALQGLGEELSKARARASELAVAMKASGDARSVRAFEQARTEAQRLKQAYAEQQVAIANNRRALAASGIDISRLSAEYGRLKTAAERAAQAQQQAAKAAQGADFQKAAAGVQAQFARLGRAAAGLFAVTLVIDYAKQLAGVADQYQQISARIRLATGATGDYVAAQREVLAIAQRQGVALSTVAQLYTRVSNALRSSGTSQAEVLAVTEDVGRALRISGASGQEAASAMLQFSQALGAGVLRGEELNAILEAAPRLAQAIADGLAVPVGQLKQLGADGVLTSELVAKALRSQSQLLEQESRALPDTIPQAWERLGNAVQRTVGELDKALGVTPAIARAITALADSASRSVGPVDELAERIAALRKEREALERSAGSGSARAAVSPLDGLATEYTRVAQAYEDLQRRLQVARQRAARPTASVGDGVLERRLTRDAEQQLQLLNELRAKLVRESRAGGGTTAAQDLARNQFEAIANRYRDSTQKLKDALEELSASAKKAGIALNSPEFKRAETALRAAFTRGQAPRRTRSPEDLTDERLAVDQAGVEASLRLEEDAIARVRQAYRSAYEDRLIDARQFYAAEGRLQQQALDARITALQRERDATAERALNPAGTEQDRLRAAAAVQRLDADIAVARRERGRVEVEAARASAAAERDLAAALSAVRLQLAETAGTATIEDRRAALQQQNRALIEQLQAAGDTSGLADVNRLIDTTAATQQLEQYERRAQQVIESLRLAEERLRSDIEAGIVTETTAQQQLTAERAKVVPQLQQIYVEMQAVEGAASGAFGPEQINNIERFRQALEQIQRTAVPLRRELLKIGESNLADFFISLGDRATTAGEKLRNFIVGFLRDFQRILAQRFAAQLLASLFTAGAGSAVGAPTGPAPTASNPFLAFASGGAVRGPGTGTSDSIPALLSNGEYVIRADAVRAWGQNFLDWVNRGMPPPMELGSVIPHFADGGPVTAGTGAPVEPNVTVVNVLDPDLVGQYLNTTKGEKAILNILRRNGKALKNL